jgi:hypothetical protein
VSSAAVTSIFRIFFELDKFLFLARKIFSQALYLLEKCFSGGKVFCRQLFLCAESVHTICHSIYSCFFCLIFSLKGGSHWARKNDVLANLEPSETV